MSQAILRAENVDLGYGARVICEDLTVNIPEGKFTVIIGPNGCGKSTLLRSLCRLLKPTRGQVLLAGESIANYPAKELAKLLGLLPQSSQAPDGIRVVDLVARGRYPHQQWFRQWSAEDQQAVAEAMAATGISELAERAVADLSGGQRQRVWIALALAQQTPVLLLDEPTTYLDIAHQVELLELFVELNRQQGKTLVAVLHDLNQAFRYGDHLIAMKGGRIIAEGTPQELATPELIERVFSLRSSIITDPESQTPMVIPRSQSRRP